MMCSGFSVRVYMPGRCLTGSRPFNTLIDASLYAAFGFFVDMVDSGPSVHRCPHFLWTGPQTMGWGGILVGGFFSDFDTGGNSPGVRLAVWTRAALKRQCRCGPSRRRPAQCLRYNLRDYLRSYLRSYLRRYLRLFSNSSQRSSAISNSSSISA